MPIQQQAPIRMGLPPVLTSLTRSVFRPMAAMARMIMNLLRSLKMLKALEGTPQAVQMVVMTLAAMNHRMKKGKIFFRLTFWPASFWPRVRRKASTRVMGMMARVRVSLTVTALSRVALPRPNMLSQVAAQAVTEDVSFTAVPAKRPKASPLVVEKPSSCPR